MQLMRGSPCHEPRSEGRRGPEAAFWGFVGGGALLLGAAAGIFLPMPHRLIGLVMAFGAGVLIGALSFELMEQAYDLAGGRAALLGLLAGALTFFVGDWLIDRRGGHRRTSPTGPQAGAASSALVLGALLGSAGHTTRGNLGLWLAVTAASTVAAALGFAVLSGAVPAWVATIQAFAPGAILTMLVDTMVPEAVEHAGPLVGLLTVLGFSTAFLLSTA